MVYRLLYLHGDEAVGYSYVGASNPVTDTINTPDDEGYDAPMPDPPLSGEQVPQKNLDDTGPLESPVYEETPSENVPTHEEPYEAPQPEPTPPPQPAQPADSLPMPAPLPYDPKRRGRGRPRKDGLPPRQNIPPEQYKVGPGGTPPVLCKIKVPNDERSARYFADVLADIHNKHVGLIRRNGDGVKNYKETVNGLLAEASLRGIKPEAVLDNRDMLDKALAVVERLETLEDVLKLRDEELEAIKKVQEYSTQLTTSYLAGRVASDEEAWRKAERLRKKAEKMGKAWGGRLALLAEIKQNARLPIPPHTKKYMPQAEEGAHAAHPLRFMAYTMRSNLSDRQAAGGATSLIDIQYHHARMAAKYWIARQNMAVHASGLVPYDSFDDSKNQRYEGCMLVMAPGTGKTTVALGIISLEINQNPHLKVLIGHAQEEQAKTNLIYLSKFYDEKDPTGQRNRALFDLPPIAQVSRTQFRLKTKETSRQPTVRAHGMTAKISGSDADYIWFDDPVDRAEREQPEERRRKSEMMTGNWLTRLRGNKTFHLTTTTLWHDDDANCRRIKLCRDRKLHVAVLTLRCGGPESHPKFNSIWPDVLPPAKLKQIWLQDPSMYAAAYMADPRPEENQIVRKLRLYDPQSPQHAQFLKGAVCYLTVDPSATARESKSNRAGVLYAGLGHVTDGSVVEKRLRFLDAHRMLATQAMLIDYIAGFSFTNRVDYCLVEMVSAFKGIGEQLENQFGISAIPAHPGLKNKTMRLRGVAPMLEDFRPNADFSGAVVEFPGRWDEDAKKLVPDERWQHVYDQILRAGSAVDDEFLDCVTQLAAYLHRTGELAPGAGFVSEAVQKAVLTGDNRIRRMLDEYAGRKVKESADVEDARFACAMSAGNTRWN